MRLPEKERLLDDLSDEPRDILCQLYNKAGEDRVKLKPQIDVMTCPDHELRAIVASLMKKEFATSSRVDALQKLEVKNSNVFLEKLGLLDTSLKDHIRKTKEQFETVDETLSGLSGRIEALQHEMSDLSGRVSAVEELSKNFVTKD